MRWPCCSAPAFVAVVNRRPRASSTRVKGSTCTNRVPPRGMHSEKAPTASAPAVSRGGPAGPTTRICTLSVGRSTPSQPARQTISSASAPTPSANRSFIEQPLYRHRAYCTTALLRSCCQRIVYHRQDTQSHSQRRLSPALRHPSTPLRGAAQDGRQHGTLRFCMFFFTLRGEKEHAKRTKEKYRCE